MKNGGKEKVRDGKRKEEIKEREENGEEKWKGKQRGRKEEKRKVKMDGEKSVGLLEIKKI